MEGEPPTAGAAQGRDVDGAGVQSECCSWGTLGTYVQRSRSQEPSTTALIPKRFVGQVSNPRPIRL
jgi:hypothetical protein